MTSGTSPNCASSTLSTPRDVRAGKRAGSAQSTGQKPERRDVLAHQFANRPAVVGDAARAAEGVVKLRVRRDAEQVENRRGEIGWRHGMFGGDCAETIARADDLSAADARAREHDRKARAPVIAATC